MLSKDYLRRSSTFNEHRGTTRTPCPKRITFVSTAYYVHEECINCFYWYRILGVLVFNIVKVSLSGTKLLVPAPKKGNESMKTYHIDVSERYSNQKYVWIPISIKVTVNMSSVKLHKIVNTGIIELSTYFLPFI